MIHFMVHCVGGCSRGHWQDLTGIRPSQVKCTHCGSQRIAIWKDGFCRYAYSGRVEYPMGSETPFGTKVSGPVPKPGDK